MAKSAPAAKKAAPAKAAPAPAAKKVAAKPAPAPEPEAEEEATEAVARTRGPRGTTEDMVIHVLVETNPKREGSKAAAVFSHYVEGMTIGEFADSLAEAEMGKEATPNLVYDTKHGFIAIDGYEVPGGVTPKEVKEPKPAKAGKVKKGTKAADPEVEAAAEEEVID
jgi:hypothetical protein